MADEQPPKGCLNPRDSQRYIRELTLITESFVRTVIRDEPAEDVYRHFVELVKQKCELADASMADADIDAVMNSVKDVTCKILRAIPEEHSRDPDEPTTSTSTLGKVEIVEGSEVPDPEDVGKALSAPLTKSAMGTITEAFTTLGEARALEGTAFKSLANLAGQVTPEQYMTVLTLTTTAPCTIRMPAPPLTEPMKVETMVATERDPRKVSDDRRDELREAMLPTVKPGQPLMTVPKHHNMRILAGVVSYKILRALREKTSVMTEAEYYSVKYNRLRNMLTGAKYRGGGGSGAQTDPQRLSTKRKRVSQFEEEEEEERKAALEEPAEPREQPDRTAKSGGKGGPKKGKR